MDDGLFILQHADDTILFMENDLEEAKNMKLLLCAFEQLSDLKINFHKSEMFYYGEARELGREYSQIFRCDMGPFHSYTLVYQCTTENLETRIGKQWRRGSRKN